MNTPVRNIRPLLSHVSSLIWALQSADDAAYDAHNCCHTDDLEATLKELRIEKENNVNALEVARHYLTEATDRREALGLPLFEEN